MVELDIAFKLAQRLFNWTPRTVDHAFIEDVEVVALDGLVGLDIRWAEVTSDQGLRRFGLILAVQEPHAAPRRDVRTVFRQIP